jgi:hypothetical protein
MILIKKYRPKDDKKQGLKDIKNIFPIENTIPCSQRLGCVS